jgi:hypothetical protein
MATKMDPKMMAMMAAKKKGAMAPARPAMPPAAPAGGMGMMRKGGMAKMAAGGLAGGHKAADGVASKGKTKGKMITMKSGGRTC